MYVHGATAARTKVWSWDDDDDRQLFLIPYRPSELPHICRTSVPLFLNHNWTSQTTWMGCRKVCQTFATPTASNADPDEPMQQHTSVSRWLNPEHCCLELQLCCQDESTTWQWRRLFSFAAAMSHDAKNTWLPIRHHI